MDERYEGFTNRETWAANLWMENERPLYDFVVKGLRTISTNKAPYQTEFSNRGLGAYEEFFRNFFTNLKNQADMGTAKPKTIKVLIEIGSVWRINYRELAEHWMAKLQFI